MKIDGDVCKSGMMFDRSARLGVWKRLLLAIKPPNVYSPNLKVENVIFSFV